MKRRKYSNDATFLFLENDIDFIRKEIMLSIIGPVLSRKRIKEEHKSIISYKKARNKSYNDTSLLLFLFLFC